VRGIWSLYLGHFILFSAVMQCKIWPWCFCAVNSNSAKGTDGNTVTPQTNYVRVDNTGNCLWEPRYERSVTHCPVDVTWFPFDEQSCNLTFESWWMSTDHLYLYVSDESVLFDSFLEPSDWHLLGAYRLPTHVYSGRCNGGCGDKIPEVLRAQALADLWSNHHSRGFPVPHRQPL